MLCLLQLSSIIGCSSACWIKECSNTQEMLSFEEQQEPPVQPLTWMGLSYWSSHSNWSFWAQFPERPMTPQLFYNTGIDQLLDEQLNHLKNMKEDIDLNLRDALSAKQGKQVWSPNQTDSERKRKTNVCLPTYIEGRERNKSFLTNWQEHPLPQKGQQGHSVLYSCSNDNTFHLK